LFDFLSNATLNCRIKKIYTLNNLLLYFIIKILDIRSRRPISIFNVTFVEFESLNLLISLLSKIKEINIPAILMSLYELLSIISKNLNYYVARLYAFFTLFTTLLCQYKTNFVSYLLNLLGEYNLVTSKNKIEKNKIKLGICEFKKYTTKSTIEFPFLVDTWLFRQQALRGISMCLFNFSLNSILEFKCNAFLIHIISQCCQTPCIELECNMLEECLFLIEQKSSTLDSYGMELVDAISRMAVLIGSNVRLKSLNHRVLLMFDNHTKKVKQVAIESLNSLITLLKVDFIPILNETITCLNDLRNTNLESIILKGIKEVIKTLEKVSGNKFNCI